MYIMEILKSQRIFIATERDNFNDDNDDEMTIPPQSFFALYITASFCKFQNIVVACRSSTAAGDY